MPSAIGILAGKAIGMTVLQTLVLSRLLTGVVAMAIGAAAIVCAEGAAVWLFALLTLPMSLVLMASASQDALLFASSAMAAALFVRTLRCLDWRSGKVLVGLTLLLGLISTARPPYVAFALLPMALPSAPRRVLAAAVIFTSAIIWASVAAGHASSNIGGFVGADPAAQMTRLLNDPLLGVRVVVNTLVQSWRFSLVGFIGVLGWSETELPRAYYVAAIVVIGFAAIASILHDSELKISIRQIFVTTFSFILAMVGIIIIIFITWTAPGQTVVEVILGVYYIPLALMGVGLLPAFGAERSAKLRNVLTIGVAIFPVVSLSVLMRAVILRYYFS